MLDQKSDSNVAPRKVRIMIRNTISALHNHKANISLRAADVISTLGEAEQDPNLPSFSRVALQPAVSKLESIHD
ncbi:MAG: UPF0147 family protein [Nitrososphaerota archaeon]|nr:UPF0147 family protein [Nitrososphaerota archaeon]